MTVAATISFTEQECPHGYTGVRADHIKLATGTTIAFTTAPSMHWRNVPPTDRAKVIHDAPTRRVLERCSPQRPR